MNGKSALGMVSEYLQTSPDKVNDTTKKEIDYDTIKDIMRNELMREMCQGSPLYTKFNTEENIRNLEHMVNAYIDIVYPYNNIPSTFLIRIFNDFNIPKGLNFSQSDNEFYISELDDWNMELTDSDSIKVISNKSQTAAMNNYYEIIQKIVPDDRYNYRLVNEYKKDIIRPIYMFRKNENEQGIRFSFPRISELLRTSLDRDIPKFVPYMYLYTGRRSVSELDKIKLNLIPSNGKDSTDGYIISESVNYGNDIYMGFPMWVSLLYEDITMMNKLLESMSFLEKIEYRNTVRCMKTIINAFEISFT